MHHDNPSANNVKKYHGQLGIKEKKNRKYQYYRSGQFCQVKLARKMTVLTGLYKSANQPKTWKTLKFCANYFCTTNHNCAALKQSSNWTLCFCFPKRKRNEQRIYSDACSHAAVIKNELLATPKY